MLVLQMSLSVDQVADLKRVGIFCEEATEVKNPDDLIAWSKVRAYEALVIGCMSDQEVLYHDLIETVGSYRLTIPIVGIVKREDSEGFISKQVRFLRRGGAYLIEDSASSDLLIATLRASVKVYNRSVDEVVSFTKHGIRLTFNLATSELRLDDCIVTLSSQERSVLRSLVLGKGCPKTRTDLVNAFCLMDSEAPQIRAIDTVIKRLRGKLDDVRRGSRSFIETVHREGYKLQFDKSTKDVPLSSLSKLVYKPRIGVE
jgi:DNA-binding response OmpR family regulator